MTQGRKRCVESFWYLKCLLYTVILMRLVVQDLDVETVMGLATNVPIDFISVGLDGDDGVYGFSDQLNYLLDEESPPTVLTTSYALDENMISTALAK